MGHGGKFLPGLGSDPLGRRVGSNEFGEGPLQGLKPLEKAVKFPVGDFRPILYMVEVVVPADFLPKGVDLLPRLSPGILGREIQAQLLLIQKNGS